MSSNFLQRFKGKTNQIGKGGIRNVLGDNNPDPIVTYHHVQKNKTSSTAKPTIKKIESVEEKTRPTKKLDTKPPKTQNPFLVSNPFYLDQQQRQRQEQLKKQERKKAFQQQKKKKQVQSAKQTTTKTSGYRSVEKKKSEKQWVKLGGLGANIGGDDWQQKKKKKDRMQQFADQVKSINKDLIKPADPQKLKQQKKEPNARQKALQYSKNVPKPVVRKVYEDQQPETKQQVIKHQNELSQLELYAAKHQKLKNMLKNNL